MLRHGTAVVAQVDGVIRRGTVWGDQNGSEWVRIRADDGVVFTVVGWLKRSVRFSVEPKLFLRGARTVSGKKPDYDVLTIPDRPEGVKAPWIRIGAAWVQKDEKGISVQLDAYPANGRLVLREPLPAKENGGG